MKSHERVLAELLECASGWEPDAHLVGNVRAGDIQDACVAALKLFQAKSERERCWCEDHCAELDVDCPVHGDRGADA